MKKISFNFVFPLLFLVILTIAFSRSISVLPPIGKLLSPYSGAIQNEKDAQDVLKINGCKAPVTIFYDKRNVAHVFADNDYDMYLAQGYVTAKDRLWQMDFISYASAGRLSEIFGANYLEYDRLQRRVGMLWAAKRTLRFIEQNPETKQALDAYTAGVNAFIESLDSHQYPFEYKLMDYKPEPWTNLKSVLIMKYVSAMLTGYEEDISMAHMLSALGKTEFRKLFPEYVNMDLEPSIDPISQVLDSLPYCEYINYQFLTNKSRVSPSSFNPRLGSNNWVINARKSASGNPVLCNDPHLALSLPSIWYEVQLCSKTTNVYGVSIPGTIGVIIGFNDKIAWGVTNGSTDVRDWYKPRIKSDYSQYELDGKWVDTRMNIEKIKVKDQDPFLDTIYSTIHGPIVIDDRFEQNPDAKNFALKWTLHEPTNEFLAFIHLNKAKDYNAFKEAISHYKCPIQNFLYAASNDTIAIHHQGMLYEKWNGQGKFLLDGTRKSHLYKKIISDRDLPQAVNPGNGFLYSANNFPAYDTVNYYINGYYAEQRAQRIKYLLSSKKKFSVEDMKRMQLDNVSEIARLGMPHLLQYVEHNESPKATKMYRLLKGWKADFTINSEAAAFYEEWWNEITRLTWDELQIQDYYLRNPDASILLNLIRKEPHSVYFNKLSSSKQETCGDIVNEAFQNVLKSFNHSTWGEKSRISITHLSRLEALGINAIPLSGHPDALNALSQNWGPSWRMIVELGKRPKGYGIYAGGQSGNAGSKHYTDFIDDWSKGNYYELLYFLDKKEAESQSKTTLRITKK